MTHIGLERRDPRTGVFPSVPEVERPDVRDEMDPVRGPLNQGSQRGSCSGCGVLDTGEVWHASTCAVAPAHLRWKGETA
jgi:hypothetical protein